MFDAKKNLAAFGRALGNETSLVACVAEAMTNVVNNDASQLAKMIETARRRNDAKAVAALKYLIGKVWKGAKVEVPEKKPAVVKIKGAEHCAEALEVVLQAGKDKLALRGPTIRERLKALETAAEPEAEPEAAPASEPETLEAEAAPASEFDAMALVLGLTPEQREAVAKALVDVAAAEALANAA